MAFALLSIAAQRFVHAIVWPWTFIPDRGFGELFRVGGELDAPACPCPGTPELSRDPL